MYLTFASFCIFNAPVFADGILPQNAPVAVTIAATPAMVETRDSYVHGVTTQVLGIIHQSGVPLATKKAQLEKTFLKVADVTWIAQFVIGKPWQSATEQQRAQYVSLYGKYLTGMYLAGLDEKSEQNLRDIKVLDIEDAFDDAFLVHTQMVMAAGNNIAVDYMVREENGQRKLVDITLEGVSMLKSHRSELGGLASSKGIDAVIAALQDKTSRDELRMAARN
jgi:phospholipid transport system substrate-binding protein